jgi:hypothetical protein
MKEIKWSFGVTSEFFKDDPQWVKDIVDEDFDPLPLLTKEIVSTRKNVAFLKCPAHTDFLKNTYVFKSPFDINFDISIEDGFAKVHCENISQEMFDHIVDLRFLHDSEKGISQYPLIGVNFLNTLISDESLLFQVFPAFMHYNDFTTKTTVIPGEFDIGKWTRPIELVFEIKNKKERIEIKKGDALSYFKFHTSDTVKIEKMAVPWDEIKICDTLRDSNKYRPLKERYSAYEQHKNNLTNN